MKTLMILLLSMLTLPYSGLTLQKNGYSDLEVAVSALNKAETINGYQKLEKEFARIARLREFDWLPYYYAAFCNAKISFFYIHDRKKGELFCKRSELQIEQAHTLLDIEKHKKELSEVYLVMSMIYRTKLFTNQITYRKEYGRLSRHYLERAKRLNPKNPRVIYLEAWISYYLPYMWGGDKNEAEKLAREALRLLPDDQAGIAPQWGKKECEELLITKQKHYKVVSPKQVKNENNR